MADRKRLSPKAEALDLSTFGTPRFEAVRIDEPKEAEDAFMNAIRAVGEAKKQTQQSQEATPDEGVAQIEQAAAALGQEATSTMVEASEINPALVDPALAEQGLAIEELPPGEAQATA